MKAGIVFGLFIAIIGFSLFAFKQAEPTPEKVIAQRLTVQVDSFAYLINQFNKAAAGSTVKEKQLQQLFLQSRLAYKKFEWAAEYFMPTISRFVNGAPVPEVELGGQRVFDPQGLQVIEGYLFPKYDVSKKKELVQQLKLLQSECDKYKAYFQNVDLFNWQIFDAGKLEVFRILTLGITGFDNPLTLHSMQEAAISLSSIETVFSVYTNKETSDDLNLQLTAATHYLQKNTSFNTFNRATFITEYGNKITVSLTRLQQQLKLPVVKYNRLLDQNAETLFDKNAFNANAYGADLSPVTAQKIALGKKLFFDPLLSGTGTRSCASCHQPDRAFTDGLIKNTIISTKKPLRRNTPTLINAALQPAQFYDLRANSLEEQVLDVVKNKEEMHGSIVKIINLLWLDKPYRQLFSAAYPLDNRTQIDTLEVTNAIALYVRSLTLLNSRFDAYMRGDKTAMNNQELHGFNLFMGKAKCATCHYMPLFNGTLPPKYLKTEAEVIGVPRSVSGKHLDGDMGQFTIIPIEPFKHAFKTPTVRNAARTAPYMHNGVFASLKQVMDFYNKGGGAGAGIKIDNQTLSSDKLHLTAKESNAIIAFIKTLDSL